MRRVAKIYIFLFLRKMRYFAIVCMCTAIVWSETAVVPTLFDPKYRNSAAQDCRSEVASGPSGSSHTDVSQWHRSTDGIRSDPRTLQFCAHLAPEDSFMWNSPRLWLSPETDSSHMSQRCVYGNGAHCWVTPEKGRLGHRLSLSQITRSG